MLFRSLSIHSRLSADTHHLIDRDLLARMKPSAILVNTARSGLVDEEALLDCLEAGRIMGAAIDTFDREPLPADSRWLTLRNVTITSHLAGSTKDAFRKTLSPLVIRKRPLPTSLATFATSSAAAVNSKSLTS